MRHPSTDLRGLPTDRDAGPFDPPRAITRLRETRPVSPLVFPDGHEGWVVTGHEAVRSLLADRRFSSRLDIGPLHEAIEIPGMPVATEPSPQVPGLFIAMDPPDHTRLRRRLTGAFTVRRMRLLTEQIDAVVEDRLDAMARLVPPVDLVGEFALPVPSLVICALLGVPYDDRDHFQTHSARFLDTGLTVEEKIESYLALTGYLRELVTRKRADPADDILSDLARQDDLEIEELTGVAFLLLLAGHETTANMLGLGTLALLEHPDQLADLRADPELMPGAVEELLRYLSIADLFYRYTTEDVDLGGETIPAGSTVVVSLLAANRDPLRFTDPDTLDIRRNARGQLSFGHGVHQCLGQQLARTEMRAGFTGLFRRFPDLRLAVDVAEVPLRTNMRLYGVHSLPVTWHQVLGPDGVRGPVDQ
ncbi:cytochrome P450 [Pseudonocardia sp. HH130630-07]|uniref:cytochrome P450 n=1 Tax=Pseudonocardia sp. HH130630-07 TaxID=1690815 RepID=UPI00081509C7|nr:cytochrome P450 [Pseudonocardia sp. HH130630-07]ANY05813.1 cytochrome [Pseudonocardia sp. HH130630-07]